MSTRDTPTDAELALHMAGGTGADFHRLSRKVARSEDWLALDPTRRKAAGWPARWVERLAPWRNLAGLAHERTQAVRQGVRLLSWRAAGYPSALRTLADPPLVLAVRGRWPPPEGALAIVGSRAATPSGRLAASRMGAAAARVGVAIVSGLARGIDSCALQAAVDEDGWAVAVLGCGIDVVYPRENTRLQETIARRGTLISEFPLGTRPDRATFPRRNRVIAALSRQVLVVEAGLRSGALITAGYALEQGLDVWAVPGSIDSPQAAGTNRLIFDGAQPIVSVEQLPELLGVADVQAPRVPRATQADPVLATLGSRVLTADELAQAAGLAVHATRARLVALELEGRVVRTAGGRYVAR